MAGMQDYGLVQKINPKTGQMEWYASNQVLGNMDGAVINNGNNWRLDNYGSDSFGDGGLTEYAAGLLERRNLDPGTATYDPTSDGVFFGGQGRSISPSGSYGQTGGNFATPASGDTGGFFSDLVKPWAQSAAEFAPYAAAFVGGIQGAGAAGFLPAGDGLGGVAAAGGSAGASGGGIMGTAGYNNAGTAFTGAGGTSATGLQYGSGAVNGFGSGLGASAGGYTSPFAGAAGISGAGGLGGLGMAGGAGGAAGGTTMASILSGVGTAGNALGWKDIAQAGLNYALMSGNADDLKALQQEALKRGDQAFASQLDNVATNRDFASSEAQKSRDFTAQQNALYNPLTMSALNQPQRKPYQDDFANLVNNPTDFFNSNPMVQAHMNLAKDQFNANGAKHGFGGTAANDYLQNIQNYSAGDYTTQANLLKSAGGFDFGPGTFGPTNAVQANPAGTSLDTSGLNGSSNVALNAGTAASNLTSASYEGFGKLFGKDWNIPGLGGTGGGGSGAAGGYGTNPFYYS